MSKPNPNLTAIPSKDHKLNDQLKKIKSLEDELNHLNILENPQEIKTICLTIIELKKTLQGRSRS